jgi:hypothetical protein
VRAEGINRAGRELIGGDEKATAEVAERRGHCGGLGKGRRRNRGHTALAAHRRIAIAERARDLHLKVWR